MQPCTTARFNLHACLTAHPKNTAQKSAAPPSATLCMSPPKPLGPSTHPTSPYSPLCNLCVHTVTQGTSMASDPSYLPPPNLLHLTRPSTKQSTAHLHRPLSHTSQHPLERAPPPAAYRKTGRMHAQMRCRLHYCRLCISGKCMCHCPLAGDVTQGGMLWECIDRWVCTAVHCSGYLFPPAYS
jgi:hypothetical protein